MEKFTFDPKTLRYQKMEPTGRKRLVRSLWFSLVVAALTITFLHYNDQVIRSPGLNRLIAEQEQIAYEISLMNREIKQYHDLLGGIEYNDDHIYRVYFEEDPIPPTLRKAGIGGSSRYQELKNLKHGDLVATTFMNLEQISRKLVVQSRSFDHVIDLARHKEQIVAARPAIQPVSINDLIRFGSAFGMRLHPILKVYRPHNGIDLTTPRGTPIFATADGKVIQASYTTGGYGNKILIDHGYGYRTLYGHCKEMLVEKGQHVKRGEVIGRVGNTGLSTRSHLHYEVHVNGRPVNPIYYYANDLSAEEYDKMITLLSKADPSFDIN